MVQKDTWSLAAQIPPECCKIVKLIQNFPVSLLAARTPCAADQKNLFNPPVAISRGSKCLKFSCGVYLVFFVCFWFLFLVFFFCLFGVFFIFRVFFGGGSFVWIFGDFLFLGFLGFFCWVFFFKKEKKRKKSKNLMEFRVALLALCASVEASTCISLQWRSCFCALQFSFCCRLVDRPCVTSFTSDEFKRIHTHTCQIMAQPGIFWGWRFLWLSDYH